MREIRRKLVGGALALAAAITSLPAVAGPVNIGAVATSAELPVVRIDSREDWLLRRNSDRNASSADWITRGRDRDWRDARRDDRHWRDDRRWRGDRRYYDRRWRNQDRTDSIGAGIAGLAAGALLGGVIAPRVYAPPVYAPAPTYYRPGTAAWVSYCSSKYRSFDPQSGTFLGYDGRRHYCR